MAVENIHGCNIAMYLRNNSQGKFLQALATWQARTQARQCSNDYFMNSIFVVWVQLWYSKISCPQKFPILQYMFIRTHSHTHTHTHTHTHSHTQCTYMYMCAYFTIVCGCILMKKRVQNNYVTLIHIIWPLTSHYIVSAILVLFCTSHDIRWLHTTMRR